MLRILHNSLIVIRCNTIALQSGDVSAVMVPLPAPVVVISLGLLRAPSPFVVKAATVTEYVVSACSSVMIISCEDTRLELQDAHVLLCRCKQTEVGCDIKITFTNTFL